MRMAATLKHQTDFFVFPLFCGKIALKLIIACSSFEKINRFASLDFHL